MDDGQLEKSHFGLRAMRVREKFIYVGNMNWARYKTFSILKELKKQSERLGPGGGILPGHTAGSVSKGGSVNIILLLGQEYIFL